MPGAKVDVVGDIWAGNGSSGNRGIYLGNITAQASLLYDSNSGNLDITPRSGYNSVFTAGNVGIGTTKTTTAALSVMNGNVGIGTFAPTNGFVYNNCAAHSGQAACWATNGAAGYCTGVVGAGGACSCTAC